MAHYTKVLDGIVIKIVVAEPDFFNDFIDDSPGEWIQTSYNTRGGKHYDCNTGVEDSGTPFRKNYAGIDILTTPLEMHLFPQNHILVGY